MPGIYDFHVRTRTGADVPLSDYRGKAMLIVNTASKCGFTPQYAALEALYKKHQAQGFAVLGFPCNQFGAQEPGSDSEIGQFCATVFGATFPVFSKIEVNGAKTHPLYAFLKHEKPGILGSERIKWNFTKFLVDRAGKVVARFAPITKPEDIENDVEKLL